jgi:uncharacterized protein (TIGR02285 family)
MKFLLLLLCLGPVAGGAISKKTPEIPTITWAFSATENISEKFRKKMMTDKHPLFEILLKNLPGYKSEYFVGTVNRIENELRTKPRTCYAASTALESRQGFAYATSITVLPAPLVITRKDVADRFQSKDHRLSLEQLVKEKDLEGIFIEFRSYGTKIDKILNAKDSHLKRQVLAPIGSNTIRMIQNRRADFTLDFSFVIEALKDAGQFGPELVILPLSDATDGIPMYVACSRTPEGLEVIKKIDRIVRDQIKDPKFRAAMTYMSPDDDQKKAYEKEVDLFIQQRGKGPDIH